MYNEPMLQQAGIKAPAKSWDEAMEHSAKLKRDKISDTPYLPNWNNSGSGTMPQFLPLRGASVGGTSEGGRYVATRWFATAKMASAKLRGHGRLRG